MKTIYAVAALGLLGGLHLEAVTASDAPASSVPSCDFRAPHGTKGLSPDEVAARDALFVTLCSESKGVLVNGIDPRSVPHFTEPAGIIGSGPQHFYPALAERTGEQGLGIFVAFVVETDGRITSATLLRSCGKPAFDEAALKWINSIQFRSPGYLGSAPVRTYKLMRVDFRLGQR